MKPISPPIELLVAIIALMVGNNATYRIMNSRDESNLSIQSVLNGCSKLTHLNLESEVPIIHDIMDKSAFDVILLAADSGRSKNDNDFSPVYYYDKTKKHQIYNNSGNGRMKVLYLQVPNLTIRNLMEYISPHVSTLNLEINQGIQLTNWFAVACELGRDWRRDIAGMTALFAKRIPSYARVMDSFNGAQAAVAKTQ